MESFPIHPCHHMLPGDNRAQHPPTSEAQASRILGDPYAMMTSTQGIMGKVGEEPSSDTANLRHVLRLSAHLAAGQSRRGGQC